MPQTRAASHDRRVGTLRTMNCPVCTDVVLAMSSREGIEIDHCPTCRGVWLDRGELDKIIERAAPAVVGSMAPPVTPAPLRDERPRESDRDRYEDRRRDEDRYRDERYREDRDRYRDDHRSSEYYRKKKKRGFLEDLFDFD